MLALSRRRDEYLMIGADIKVQVIRVRGGQVRLGIDAPRSLRISRGPSVPRKRAKRCS